MDPVVSGPYGVAVVVGAALSFVAATFELGNPQSAVLAVDPVKKSNYQQKLEAVAGSSIYMLKVVILGFLIKTYLWQVGSYPRLSGCPPSASYRRLLRQLMSSTDIAQYKFLVHF